jgi:hypothetical protein
MHTLRTAGRARDTSRCGSDTASVRPDTFSCAPADSCAAIPYAAIVNNSTQETSFQRGRRME